MNKITVEHSIRICADPEKVWTYTQNWRTRHEWDRTVLGAEYISESQPVTVRVRGFGGLHFRVTYKMSTRPRLTTVVMSELNSKWILGGGGSWRYETTSDGTLWTQHNTLILREDFLGRLTRRLFQFALASSTRDMMKRAKLTIENSL